MVRRLVMTLVLAACVACQAGVSAPTAGPSTAPPTAGDSSPPSLPPSAGVSTASSDQPQATARRIQGTFASARYGYDWTLPEGWSVIETPGTGGVHPGEPGLDTFTDGRGTTMTVGVTAVAPT